MRCQAPNISIAFLVSESSLVDMVQTKVGPSRRRGSELISMVREEYRARTAKGQDGQGRILYVTGILQFYDHVSVRIR